MYSGSFKVDSSDDVIPGVFSAEDKKFGDRASYDIKKQDGFVEFTVEAKDAVAFRAILNSIVKSLIIVEKMEDVE